MEQLQRNAVTLLRYVNETKSVCWFYPAAAMCPQFNAFRAGRAKQRYGRNSTEQTAAINGTSPQADKV